MSKDQPLRVSVEGDELVIRIGISTLAFAAHTPEGYGPLGPYESNPAYKITNERVFADDVVRSLTQEDEIGGTPLNKLLDEAAGAAVEDGSVAVEELPAEKEEEEVIR